MNFRLIIMWLWGAQLSSFWWITTTTGLVPIVMLTMVETIALIALVIYRCIKDWGNTSVE